MPEHSFCEAGTAGPFSRWHIRQLTPAGRKLGGGADTKSLCDKRVSWDLVVDLTAHHLEANACPLCVRKYAEIKDTSNA